jgi:ATP-binding cassette subfamily C protein
MTLVRRVWRIVDVGTRRRIVGSAAGSVFLALLDAMAVLLVFPLIQLLVTPKGTPVDLPFVGAVASADAMHDAAILAVIVTLLFVLKSSLSVAFLKWNLRFVLDADVAVATRVFASHLDGTAPRDTAAVQRTLAESLRKVFPEGLATVLPAAADALVIVLLSAMVLVLAPVEAVVAVAVFVAAAYGYRRAIHGRTARASAALHTDQRHALAISGEALRASREIALSGSSAHFVDEFATSRRRVARAQRTIAFNEQLPRSFLEICLLICTASVAAVAFGRRDTASAVALVGMFAAVGFRVLPSLNRVLLAASRSRSAMPSVEQIELDLAGGASAHRRAAAVVTTPIERVDVCGVTVRVHGRDAPLLEGVELHLRRGEMVGVLGPSGAGKSSLVNAVLGFLPVSEGEVLLNGRTGVSGPASWQRRAAYVPQDVVVLDAPLRENVGFGLARQDIDDARVLGALEGAHLHDLLIELPEGLSTELGEAGARLSGGQRQRLGIARALYHHADVLVLDESTAGLDHETEQRILATLAGLARERIVLVVSHHRAVMEHCDRLVVLDEGRVTGIGTLPAVQGLLEQTGLTA